MRPPPGAVDACSAKLGPEQRCRDGWIGYIPNVAGHLSKMALVVPQVLEPLCIDTREGKLRHPLGARKPRLSVPPVGLDSVPNGGRAPTRRLDTFIIPEPKFSLDLLGSQGFRI